ncbi:hypothetical protein JZ751_005308 [Albula glossodonta]|uniref:Apical junction molecule ajm1 alpha/beta domain-containing protein n=1 Tax=Albula glossodonta TaxID=121402 RepID=A0A8T2N621_9TELE|nr:hypothetical protein JZ751_005308 [Albula glossodonta]
MTRTDPPDLLASTAYRDIKASPSSTRSEPFRPSEKCEGPQFRCTLEDTKKRHCRSFDLESLGDPKHHAATMEYPYRRAERHGAHPDVAWNALGQQGQARFSSPDLFNHRYPAQYAAPVMAGAGAELKRRARSKSAPRVKTSLTPVSFEASPPVARRGREVSRSPRDPPRKPEASPRREASYTAAPPPTPNPAPNRPLVNEVHPIKLQPQRSDASRYSPLYVPPDCYDESRADGRQHPQQQQPHVRCRVDIKPDAAVLQQTARKPTPPGGPGVPWQRFPSSGSHSLTVPRPIPTSRTPTPTDSYTGEYRPAYPYPNSAPSGSFMQPMEIPLQRMPSPREYYGRERRAFSSPNVLTKFFYTDDHTGFSSPVALQPRTYFQEDLYSNPSPTLTPKMQYVQDPRTRVIHTAPTRQYYADIDPYTYPYPLQAGYPKPYTATEPGSYIIQTPPAPRAFYGEDPRAYPVQTVPPKIFYVDDFYGSEVSSYSNRQPPSSQTSQFTPTRVRQDPAVTPWYANPCMEPTRLGGEAPRTYSKSWDNILDTHVEREQPRETNPRERRRQSHDDLLYQGKRTLSPNDDRRQPVVVNLSSSPRRYAALSLSENSLMDRSPTDGTRRPGTGGSSGGGSGGLAKPWFVTPEITITDNDTLRVQANSSCDGGGPKQSETRSASWDALDSRSSPVTAKTSYQEDYSTMDSTTTKEKTHNSSSLQQSLEQLDELLADLVIDYKPPASRRPSEDLLDQLKKLIGEAEEEVSAGGKSTKRTSSKEPDSPGPLKKQPTSTKLIPGGGGEGGGVIGDQDSGCGEGGHQRRSAECSPDESTDEDDTMICSNRKCQRTETLFNACLYFKSCHSCYTYYCSRNCRREDWDVHKESCLYGRVGSICRHIIKFCRETADIHKAFSRIAKVGYLSRGRGVLFLGFPSPGSSSNFLQYGLESLLMTPTYLSLRELDGFRDNLGDYCRELQVAGDEYDPTECFLLNVSIAVGDQVPDRPSPRVQAPTVRKYAKVSLASYSPERKAALAAAAASRKDGGDMETLILTPPPGTADIDLEGEEGRKAREVCFINIQRELRTRGVFLRHEYPQVYRQLCDFVETNERFTPTTIYPIDKRTGKQFMCMIMAASEPRTLDWVGTPNLLDDII